MITQEIFSPGDYDGMSLAQFLELVEEYKRDWLPENALIFFKETWNGTYVMASYREEG